MIFILSYSWACKSPTISKSFTAYNSLTDTLKLVFLDYSIRNSEDVPIVYRSYLSKNTNLRSLFSNYHLDTLISIYNEVWRKNKEDSISINKIYSETKFHFLIDDNGKKFFLVEGNITPLFMGLLRPSLGLYHLNNLCQINDVEIDNTNDTIEKEVFETYGVNTLYRGKIDSIFINKKSKEIKCFLAYKSINLVRYKKLLEYRNGRFYGTALELK